MIRTLLLVAAIVCFVIALLISGGTFHGNAPVWGFAGLALFAGAHLP